MSKEGEASPGKISAGADRHAPEIVRILDKKITKRHKRVRYLVKRADGRVGRWVAEKKLRIDKQAQALIDGFEAGQNLTAPPVYVESSPAPYDSPARPAKAGSSVGHCTATQGGLSLTLLAAWWVVPRGPFA